VKEVIGNLFESKAEALVNPVNCVGVMGKGLALEFKRRFPEMFADYLARCARKEVRLGEPYLYFDASGTRIVNFPTKDHWRSPSHLEDIERGLDHFVKHFVEWGFNSVAFPQLGCGNGGLTWDKVGPLMLRRLGELKLRIEVYAPAARVHHEPRNYRVSR
jgi:O-acetyl-ADP-ribose deacetylase (regulator of RNase III)